LRGTALLMLPFVSNAAGLFMFAVLYGLDWYAWDRRPDHYRARNSVPEVGQIFGTVFVFHQLRRRRPSAAVGREFTLAIIKPPF
jgi:hypothetical protein